MTGAVKNMLWINVKLVAGAVAATVVADDGGTVVDPQNGRGVSARWTFTSEEVVPAE